MVLLVNPAFWICGAGVAPPPVLVCTAHLHLQGGGMCDYLLLQLLLGSAIVSCGV